MSFRYPIRLFLDGWRRYGDVVRFRLVGGEQVLLAVHPDQVRQVLQNPDRR